MACGADILRYQVAATAWANQRTLVADGKLRDEELKRDFGSSEKSILATLVHIYRAERVWLARLTGGPMVEFRVEGDDTLAAIETNWPSVSEKWLEWGKELSEEGAQLEFTYQDLRKNTHTNTIWQIVLHVVNHSTHHRGQAIGFMRALGHTPPSTDSISFARGL